MSTARTMGTLSVIYGSLMVLMGLCTGSVLLALPALGRVMEGVQEREVARQEERRKGAISVLDEELAKATTEEEKAAIRVRKREVQDAPARPLTVNVGDFSMFRDRRIQLYSAGQMSTMLVLNILLIIAGIGLVRRREWGRRLALGASGVKVLALLLFSLVYAMGVAPIMGQLTMRDMGGLMRGGATAPGVEKVDAIDPAEVARREQLASQISLSNTLTNSLMTLGGLVFPVASLVLLSRPKVRQALEAGLVEGSTTTGDSTR
jgi:hypothetical protein